MTLVNKTVLEFIEKVDSNQPTPGGGSVSALATSLGVSLAKMVGHLTVPKKAFKGLEPSLQESIVEYIESLDKIKKRLVELIDEDTIAYNKVMSAFKMPKETDVDKQKRRNAIQEGTLCAIEVPFEVAQKGLEAMTLFELIIKHGNKNAISDLGVGALLLYAGIEGALLNVQINLGMLKDSKKVAFYTNECQEISRNSAALKDSLLSLVKDVLAI